MQTIPPFLTYRGVQAMSKKYICPKLSKLGSLYSATKDRSINFYVDAFSQANNEPQPDMTTM
jgi:hypothetical protein